MKNLTKSELKNLKVDDQFKTSSVIINGYDYGEREELFTVLSSTLNKKGNVVLVCKTNNERLKQVVFINIDKKFNEKGQKRIYASGSKIVHTYSLVE